MGMFALFGWVCLDTFQAAGCLVCLRGLVWRDAHHVLLRSPDCLSGDTVSGVFDICLKMQFDATRFSRLGCSLCKSFCVTARRLFRNSMRLVLAVCTRCLHRLCPACVLRVCVCVQFVNSVCVFALIIGLAATCCYICVPTGCIDHIV